MKINKKIPLWVGFVFFLLLVVNAFTSSRVDSHPPRFMYIEYNDPFSQEKFKNAIKDLKFKHPELVFAQAILETGHFESELFLENNNLFGMKVAYSRPTTAIGTKNGHAYYNHWRDSLVDYALYTSAFMRYSDEDKILTHLGKYYAEDPRYEKKLRSIISTIEPM